MKKVISLFQRNYEGDRLVRDELVPGAEWVAAGEGVATVKWDGSACLFHADCLFKRYDAKGGKKPPEGFVPAQDPDPTTGHWPGWVLCLKSNAADRWHVAALGNTLERVAPDVVKAPPTGTYEAVGPHFQGNPYELPEDILIRHGAHHLTDAPREFATLAVYLRGLHYLVVQPLLAARPMYIEGIVWHHPDGRMVKIKARDFGISWPPAASEKR